MGGRKVNESTAGERSMCTPASRRLGDVADASPRWRKGICWVANTRGLTGSGASPILTRGHLKCHLRILMRAERHCSEMGTGLAHGQRLGIVGPDQSERSPYPPVTLASTMCPVLFGLGAGRRTN